MGNVKCKTTEMFVNNHTTKGLFKELTKCMGCFQ